VLTSRALARAVTKKVAFAAPPLVVTHETHVDGGCAGRSHGRVAALKSVALHAARPVPVAATTASVAHSSAPPTALKSRGLHHTHSVSPACGAAGSEIVIAERSQGYETTATVAFGRVIAAERAMPTPSADWGQSSVKTGRAHATEFGPHARPTGVFVADCVAD